MQRTSQSIYQIVCQELIDALHIDEEDIKPISTLQTDLGAESIDFLDIVFRLKKRFDIKIPRDELFPEAIFSGDPVYVYQGRVTARGIQELRTRLPYADLTKFEQDPCVEKISDLYTVGMICKYLEHKLGVTA